jgi:Icc-related predicted phosphoesterase
MKIQIVSDLHLEHRNDLPVLHNAGADVLILAGDICQAEDLYRNPRDKFTVDGQVADLSQVMTGDWRGWDARRFREFFQHCSDNWPHVLYVSGNHEHYDGRWERTSDILRTEMAHYHNIHFMDQDSITIDGIRFLGVPLWTSFKDADPNVMWAVKSYMSDYRWIKHFNAGQWGRLRPQDTLAKHQSDVSWLTDQLAMDHTPTVIIGHHAPSYQSIHEMYRNQADMNYAFCSSLDHMMVTNYHIRLWVHGHVHNCFDYSINQARVVCNPLGYPSETTGFDPALVVEV